MDLTREQLAELRDRCSGGDPVSLTTEQALSLVDMASRCVSVPVLKKLAMYDAMSASGRSYSVAQHEELWDEFLDGALEELRLATGS